MGHCIYLCNEDNQIIDNVFPCIGEGNIRLGSSTQEDLYITFNVTKMVYEASDRAGFDIPSLGNWLNGKKCKEVLPAILKILDELLADPDYFEALNPDNGWGNYDSLVLKWKSLATACTQYPEAMIVDDF